MKIHKHFTNFIFCKNAEIEKPKTVVNQLHCF